MASSYCKLHDTHPADNEPCWQCVNAVSTQLEQTKAALKVHQEVGAEAEDELLKLQAEKVFESNVLNELKFHDYCEGYKLALRMYAWWKDGVQYVGSCGKTLKEALEEVEEDIRKEIP